MLTAGKRRFVHLASSLPFAEHAGVGKFLSPNSIDLINRIQRNNLNNLNRHVKGTTID